MRVGPTLANGVLEFVMDPRIKDRTYHQQPHENMSTGLEVSLFEIGLRDNWYDYDLLLTFLIMNVWCAYCINKLPSL